MSAPQLCPCSLMPPCLSAPRSSPPSIHLPSAVRLLNRHRLLKSRSDCKREGMSRGNCFFLISPRGRLSWGAQPEGSVRILHETHLSMLHCTPPSFPGDSASNPSPLICQPHISLIEDLQASLSQLSPPDPRAFPGPLPSLAPPPQFS